MANAKHLLLEYDCGEPLNRLYIGDPFRTRQIVENLLSNALKFTQEGSITLRAALENAQGQEGFGLGLAITKKLILLLEGDIRIESETGKGSTFHVYLPLPQAPNTDKKNKREEGIKNFILKAYCPNFLNIFLQIGFDDLRYIGLECCYYLFQIEHIFF